MFHAAWQSGSKYFVQINKQADLSAKKHSAEECDTTLLSFIKSTAGLSQGGYIWLKRRGGGG